MIPAFVTWSWCAEQSRVVLADCRWYWNRPGRVAYLSGHLPGAVFVDLDADLSGRPTPLTGRQPLPEPAAFAAAMGRLGIDGSAPVVAYDDAGGVIAARLAWMLRALDLDAAVLSGGMAAFPGGLEIGPVEAASVRFVERAWPAEAVATVAEVASGRWPLVDARPPNRYRGEDPEIDARLGAVPEADPRRGHIPGAVNVPCRDHLTSEQTIAAPERVRQNFAAAGIETAEGVICYCGAGVTACHDLLAMEYAGLGRGRLFPGSWSAWSSDPERPVETG